MDAERWQRLSPLLDALLELLPEQRDEHLAALRREDPALADDRIEILHAVMKQSVKNFMVGILRAYQAVEVFFFRLYYVIEPVF